LIASASARRAVACCSRVDDARSRRSITSALRSRASSRVDMRCSRRCTSARRERASASASALVRTASSFASSISSLDRVRASSTMREASSAASRAARSASASRMAIAWP
jgi:hypothetical protein